MREKKYIYLHGKGNTVDVLDPLDMSHVRNLDLDSKRMIVACEVSTTHIFFGCEGGYMFSFSLSDFSRTAKSSAQQPVTARSWLENDIVLAGESSGYI